VEYIEASAQYKAERDQAAKKMQRRVGFALAALMFGAIVIFQWKAQRAEKTEEVARTLATQQEQISGVVQQTQTALEKKDYKTAEELVQKAKQLSKPSYGGQETKR
jgi:uncharacterized protein YoxC